MDPQKIILTITLILMVVIFSIGFYQHKIADEQLDINGLEIPQSQFADLIDVAPEGNFVLCDIDEDECFIFNKRKIQETK